MFSVSVNQRSATASFNYLSVSRPKGMYGWVLICLSQGCPPLPPPVGTVLCQCDTPELRLTSQLILAWPGDAEIEAELT